ncbi:Hypothetical predicted protein [Octopus vulgaris]|uniref:Reverse transcriptase domain-containing protein n=1 Tax=Octopus vulgaris TaxID=6645 RepID=A0AA36FEV6_OCTVU|nr:Hypothetical predicted protein [Octopus vulgaris]
MLFIDLTKALDAVNQQAIWKVLKKLGIPDKMLNVIIFFHEEMKAAVMSGGEPSASFDVTNGKKQSCVMAPVLFALYFSVMLKKRIDNQEYQVLVLKNEQGEVKLEALQLPSRKADTVVKGITAVLVEYNLWNCVKMIVADTTSVNTGKGNGIIAQLQRLFVQKGLKE